MGESPANIATEAVMKLCEVAASRTPPANGEKLEDYRWECRPPTEILYQNKNERLNIDFTVERLAFPAIQTIDPRIVRIPPGKCNEKHKHAHESVFVILEGEGEVLIGDRRVKAPRGSITYVPRWLFHQSINTGTTELVILAITDFGFTSAVLGDYDRKQRLKEGGSDAAER